MGIPLFHMELAIGQRLRKGSIGVWTTISPYLGLGCFTVSSLIGIYYNTVLTWVLWYLLNSFQNPLPWSACPPDRNRTGFVEECQRSSSVSYFWYRQTLNVTADINDSGSIQWQLMVCLVASWAVVYLCIIRGIETTGKVRAHRPASVPPPSRCRGPSRLLSVFAPRILQNPRVWLDAATQIFFSLSLAFGGHIAFSSYNPPRNNCKKDAVTIALVNSMTSLYAAIIVFSVLGFKAANDHGRCLDRNILHLINAFDFPDQSISRDDYAAVLAHLNVTQPERVAGLGLDASGTGLAFIVFTEAILHMPGAPGWAVLFFGMLFTLGLSSMFGNMEAVITPLLDMGVMPRWVPKEVLTGDCFLASIHFTLHSGNYWLEVFDRYAASLNLALGPGVRARASCLCGRFCDDVAWMTGRRPSLYWRVTWKVVSPLLLLTIFVAYIALLDQFPTQQENVYPGWVQVTCVLLSFLPVLLVPAVALAQLLVRHRRKKKDALQDMHLKPQDSGAC
uniref:Solute carrier family 6 member 18 n=1 Tax=Equus asinus asinus TaxID=83772 RepID=A0A8C4PSD9_EQUAS